MWSGSIVFVGILRQPSFRVGSDRFGDLCSTSGCLRIIQRRHFIRPGLCNINYSQHYECQGHIKVLYRHSIVVPTKLLVEAPCPFNLLELLTVALFSAILCSGHARLCSPYKQGGLPHPLMSLGNALPTPARNAHAVAAATSG